MAQHKVSKVVVTVDGTEHTIEGDGYLNFSKTYRQGDKGEKEPIASVEVIMNVPAEWGQGKEGKFVSTPTVTF